MNSIRFSKIYFLFCTVLTIFLLGGTRCAKSPLLDFQNLGGDFVLTDSKKEIFDTRKNWKKVNLIFFGYTHCPDVCPGTLNALYSLMNRFDKNNLPFQVIFVSVDPERDSYEKLGLLLETYPGMPLVTLTGQAKEIENTAKMYGVKFSKDNIQKDFYTVNHSSSVFAVDQNGKVRYIFKFGESLDLMERIVRILAK